MSDKNKGYISLWRCVEEHFIWNADPVNRFQAWLDLILMANHKAAEIVVEGRPVMIGRGQMWTSFNKMSLRWGWSIKKVRAFTELLKRAHMIEVKPTNKGTLLTIVNYGFYQDMGHAKDMAEGTQRVQQRARRGYTNNNVNNENNGNNGIKIKGRCKPQ